MGITLDDDTRQYLATFEDVTGVNGRDCIVTGERESRLLIVVETDRIGEAIGPGGRTVTRFEKQIDMPVRLVEGADDPEEFVANALAPAAVYNVTISENDDTVAYVEVAREDRGVAIGSSGRRIDAARRLAERHFGIDDVQLI
ncbi:NusA-like transcription termination signal-binding factor [Natronobacterium gregoryi]|uniref:Probable transcription termination protein NusA n=2 Tax=Natronobacterium gregoryi TaxID=44930 RepID=L0AGY1_NATGS|nr:NusA-like transcription termination signal-binding factor [Natronobacterium gregoryi]AFZ72427.1 NusA family KH domain protein [Natronobacterium gregoryi SP2]ELY64668.1 transcription elongation factor NusA-like protein [Natronobacterium gregoryi SP2]PLK19251.1 NusA-like transcription termination signal-binding factor [Natronobacterium gregoryi SP2]SFJ55857.1 N utilization substance protein A [Natronobacterium gregoryi]